MQPIKVGLVLGAGGCRGLDVYKRQASGCMPWPGPAAGVAPSPRLRPSTSVYAFLSHN